MLPPSARLRRRTDFSEVVRRGRRAGRPALVVHLLCAEDGALPGDPGGGSRVGFIVSRQVGNSVQRHRVVRRLRHVMRDRLSMLPAGARVVVRARPRAASCESADLGRDLDRLLARLLGARP